MPQAECERLLEEAAAPLRCTKQHGIALEFESHTTRRALLDAVNGFVEEVMLRSMNIAER